MTSQHLKHWITMTLPARLVALRKARGLSQQAMAELLGIHANSLKKYETDHRQPSLDVLRKIAKALNVSADFLLFEEHERGPQDDLALQFEAVSQLPPEEQAVVKEVLESLIIKYQARRWDSARAVATGAGKSRLETHEQSGHDA